MLSLACCRRYLIVEDAIPPREVEALHRLTSEIQRERAAVTGRNALHPDEDVRHAVFSRTNRLQQDPNVIRLLTNAKVFPKIIDIMGTNIYCWHCFSPNSRGTPAAEMPDGPPPQSEQPRYGFHRAQQLFFRRAQPC